MADAHNNYGLDNSDFDAHDSFLARHGTRLMGLGLIGLSIILLIALSGWNVNDPSLTHATDRAVTNFIGFPGAAVSDLLIQFFGLSSIALVGLPIIWGIQFTRLQRYDVSGSQVFSFLVLVIFASGFLACIATPATWPLPTGLGGVIGNIVVYPIDATVPANYNALGKVILAVICLVPLALLFKPAFSLRNADHQSAEGTIPKKRKPVISQGDNFVDEEPSSTLGSYAMGALYHWSYLGQTTIKRLFMSRKTRVRRQAVPQHDQTLVDDTDVGLSNPLHSITRFTKGIIETTAPDDGLGDYLQRANNQSLQDEDTIAAPSQSDYSQPSGEQVPHAIAPQFTERKVTAAAPPEKPGKRVIAERQPSLPMGKTSSEYELPPISFLTEAPFVREDEQLSADALTHNAEMLEGVLEDFGVKGEIVHVRPGPVVTLYELEPAPGIKSSRVIGLADDIARSMSAIAARVAVIPGKNAIGIELPNQKRETVYLHEAISSKTFENHKGKLPLCLGKTIGGESVIADLAKMPHLLVAGTTGSGKSVAINTMILSLLYRFTPEQCKLIMIDPKMLELSVYDGIPHLLTPVVTDPKKAVVALKWTVREMEDRYKKMSKVGVRNIDGFNTRVKQAADKNEPIVRTIQTGYDQETGEAIYESEELELNPMPYIVVIIDEMADLMMVAGKDIEGAIQRLAQMARAAGIHVIMATQRPSVDVITGTIKANFPTRISFQVTSKIDSRTILGEQGAEQLLGMGDMLYMAGGGRIQRVHGPFVDDGEVEKIVLHLKDQGIPQYLEAVTEEVDEEEAADAGGTSKGNVSDEADPYDQAVAVVLRDKKASTSYIQRRLGIGYNRAASLIERMEEEGVIGPANHAGKREILVGEGNDEEFI